MWPGTLRETEKEDTELSVLFRIITVRTPPVREKFGGYEFYTFFD